ncbi:unnamed protein product [Somion occarium]|uniref:Uncharacterized protein n=1 Tax=Somion occarium TaxID=3059160 RepID=A0ABP1E152_9APHY
MADAGPSFSTISEPGNPVKLFSTPSATPPISPTKVTHTTRDLPPPAKRPRLASTPSSVPSLSRSTPTSSSSATNEELNDARRASALRVLNVWSQLEERYARGLDEDDIIDFQHDVIIKDKGVLKKKRRIGFGSLADSARFDVPSAGEDDEPTEEDDDDDVDEIDAFAPGIEVEEQLKLKLPRRYMPPIGEVDPADKEDLQAFLEADRRMKEMGAFDEDSEDGSVADVLQALADGLSSTSDIEDGYTSFEEDLPASEGASLPPSSSSPPSSPRRTPGPRPYTDDDFSDDELAKWESEEEPPALKTPQQTKIISTPPRMFPEIIDLTSPSPQNTPQKLSSPRGRSKSRPKSPSLSPVKATPKAVPRAKSKTPAPTVSKTKTPARAKSKTPARELSSSPIRSAPKSSTRAKSKTPARRIRAVTPPPVASSSKVKLPTPPRSSLSHSSIVDEPSDNPFFDDVFSLPRRSPSPLPSPPKQSTYVRPKPKPRRRSTAPPVPRSDSEDSNADEPPPPSRVHNKTEDDIASTSSPTVRKAQDKSSRSDTPLSVPARKTKVVAEVVLARRCKSRAPSTPPPRRTPSREPSSPIQSSSLRGRGYTTDSIANGSTSKGKNKVKPNSSPLTANKSSRLSPPALQQKGSDSRAISSEIDDATPAPAKRGYKRKRVLSFTSDEDSDDVPLASSSPVRITQLKGKTRTATPSPPSKGRTRESNRLKDKSREKEKVSSEAVSPKPRSPPKTKSKKVSRRSPEIVSDSEPATSPPSRRSTSKAPRASSRAPSQPQPFPVYPYSTPHTPQHQQNDKRRGHHHPPYPSMPMLPIPVHDPQAQFHFAQAVHHLAYLMAGSAPPLGSGTSYPPYHIPWPPPFTPSHQHRRKSRLQEGESSSPEAGPSTSRSDPVSTPTHTSHPYPYSYDPNWSSSTLPPSSPPQSSPLPSSSPPTSPVPLRPAIRERSQSRGRRVSFKLDDGDRPRVWPGDEDVMILSTPDRLARDASPEIPIAAPSRSRRRRPSESASPSPLKPKREAELLQPEAGGKRERGQTPGPPERSRSLTRR